MKRKPICSMVPLAVLAVLLFSVQSAAQAQKQLTSEEVVLLGKLRQTSGSSNSELLQSQYIAYRDDVKRLQAIEQELHSTGYVICDPPIESAGVKLLRKSRIQECPQTFDRTDILFEDLRQLETPLFKAKRSIVKLVGSNVKQIDSFLGISSETMRFIQTGRHTNLIGT